MKSRMVVAIVKMETDLPLSQLKVEIEAGLGGCQGFEVNQVRLNIVQPNLIKSLTPGWKKK